MAAPAFEGSSERSNVVIYDRPPPLKYRGSGHAYVDGLNQWFKTWAGSVEVELAEPTVLIDSDTVIVFGLSRMRGIKKSGGLIDSWNRRTMVLRREAGRLLIIHEDSSYPLEMDGSGNAATGLKPQKSA